MTKIQYNFVLFGDKLNPKQFEQIVSIDGSVFWNKGDFCNDYLKNIPKDENGWEYRSKSFKSDEFENLMIHFNINFSKEDIVNYLVDNKIENKLYIIVYDTCKSLPSIIFSDNDLKLLSKLNSKIEIDMY